jgi:hypothetical protein
MTRSPLKAQNSLVQPACSDDLPARGTFRTPESGLRNALEAGQAKGLLIWVRVYSPEKEALA